MFADAGAAATSKPRTAPIASTDNIVIVAPDTKSSVCVYKYIYGKIYVRNVRVVKTGEVEHIGFA